MNEERIEPGGVPARVYLPETAKGLLLLGHRGTQSKDHPRFVELGRRFASETGLGVVCIDAPSHGERAPSSGDTNKDLAEIVGTIGGPQDITVPDWSAVCDELRSVGPPLAYVGFSMGAMMGIAVIAALESIVCGVLWVAGLPRPDPTAEQSAQTFTDNARAAGRADVLMVNMTDDEMMGPNKALRLFGAIGGSRKQLHFHPGDHGTEPEEALETSIRFIQSRVQPE